MHATASREPHITPTPRDPALKHNLNFDFLTGICIHDDPIMNDSDALLRVEVGVGVLVGLAAVRRPARVGDADVVACMF